MSEDKKENAAAEVKSDSNDKGGRLPARNFPRATLERALKVSSAIRHKNAGKPWEPKFVAKEVGISEKSTNFRDLVNAARDYGLVKGTYRGRTLELDTIGKACAYPSSPQAEAEAKEQAFRNVASFEGVLSYYGGSQLPEMTYLANVLETRFGIHPEYHAEFVTIFKENCRFLGIGAQYKIGATVEHSGGSTQPVEVISREITTRMARSGGDITCFVIMPFVERDEEHPAGFFAEVLRSLIAPACEKVGFSCTTANRQGSDVIQSTIVNQLLQADLVIADLTEHNPNVLFELGMRMAEDRPVALIRASGTGKIFDVDNMLRVYDYNPCLWPTTVADDVPNVAEHIKAAWENRDSDISYMKLLRQHAETSGQRI